MAEEGEPQLESKREANKGFWGSLSLFQKIILGILIISFIFIGWVFLFGGVNSIWELAFVIVLAIVLFFIAYIVIVASKLAFKHDYYSPKEDMYTKYVNMAIDYCPNNLNNLYTEGSDWKKHVFIGKIVGCLGIPYFIGEAVQDANGKQVWAESKFTRKKVPVYKNITYGKDGDTMFVFEKGWFVFKKRHIARVNHDLHTELNGDVIIHDINLVPYGKFFEYPYKQIQKGIGRIMQQAQLEVIIATHEHQGDMISQSADAGTYYNPFFRMVEKGRAEITREG